jgi:hypothetical protein
MPDNDLLHSEELAITDSINKIKTLKIGMKYRQ